MERQNAAVDIEKQLDYWRAGAREDWDVGADLVTRGKARHGLFFLHLALEKALKALVCRATSDFAPKTHGLVRLADLAGVTLTDAQKDVLAIFTQYNLVGRYPDTLGPAPTPAEALARMREAKEIYEWLHTL
jgi:HEPN domain-containing protein